MTNKLTSLTRKSAKALIAGSLLSLASSAWAFDSGSTGADGAFSPQVDTTLQLPEDGVFNFTTVNIPSGVTVTFAKNATNTPVVWLASGDVIIEGRVDLLGGDGVDTGAKGDGNIGDDGQPGEGGPGGFDGGFGGTVDSPQGGNGLGPGGGGGGLTRYASSGNTSLFGCGGAGAGHAGVGARPRNGDCRLGSSANPGVAYGAAELQPLIGGSGGGGGHAGAILGGAGGGGGGGAILIASSGTVNVVGEVRAFGGRGGDVAGASSGGPGAPGSGGAIRIVATTIDGNGNLQANAFGRESNDSGTFTESGTASVGRIRLEAEALTRTSTSLPAYSFSGPQPLFLANIPGVRITEVAGLAVPASPSGAGDVIIPEATPNPVSIEFATTNIPVGNTIELTVTPQSGANAVVVSNAISGTDENGTATVSVDIPDGPSVLSASVTFTVAVASTQQDFSQFAQGNEVEKVRIDFDPAKGSMTTFIAKNGDEFTWPSNTVAIN